MELFINGIRYPLESPSPDMTLLRFLRTEAGLKGTKEGCASGDCGACTVLVGDGKSVPVTVNSCIALLGSMDGMHIYTVDGLAEMVSVDDAKGLHPAQQSMVDCHGSQCGFCTPGFVMSLAGLMEKQCSNKKTSATREEILDAISGNLCRCTGYRPIVEAGVKMFELAQCPSLTDLENGAQPNGKPQNDAQPESSFDSVVGYFMPKTEKELAALIAEHSDAQFVAGGTDKVLEITQQFSQPTKIIDLGQVVELTGISRDQGYLVIGAAATYSEIEQHCAELMPEFISLLHRLGSRQIRNRGTMGGNIANGSPIADTPPALFIWEAELELVKSGGKRLRVPINDFYLGYRKTLIEKGDYLSAIRIPLENLSSPYRLYKISKRYEDDISAVMGAFALEFEDDRPVSARIAYGGMAATPVRAPKTEAFLLSEELPENWLDEAVAILASEFTPMTDVRATAAYRREVAANLLYKAVANIRDGATFDPYDDAYRNGADVWMEAPNA